MTARLVADGALVHLPAGDLRVYEVPDSSSLLKDLAFTVNVDNVFDKAPPLYRGTYSGGGNTSVGFANGFTLGRLVRVGVSKKF
ncbi:hypothetical protein WG901_00075 [Novosphingobium sp. PS1R-30]|uniref:TonB-dependent receptor n=1 Tax=Novosphingobium anseongense TaxID=3133436 RepID=A0ABU8RPR4_9SPHN